MSKKKTLIPQIFFAVCLILAMVVGYDAYVIHLAKSDSVARRKDALLDMTAALEQGALESFMEASDRFLASSDPWMAKVGFDRGDPRNPSVGAARETAVDLLISNAAMDGNVDAVSAAIDRKR